MRIFLPQGQFSQKARRTVREDGGSFRAHPAAPIRPIRSGPQRPPGAAPRTAATKRPGSDHRGSFTD